jgi:signal transduction histidine kinase
MNTPSVDKKTKKTATLMIVDDNPHNLEVLYKLLQDNGYDALPVNSGNMALRALEHRQVDLIMLDIRMPDMDGYQVCAQLKNNPHTRDIPVLFISALREPLDKVRAFHAGGQDYITKPFNSEEVLARVSTHLQVRRLQQQLRDYNNALEQRVAERTAELDQRNEALYQANAALEKALLSKKEFLMLMNHELHTPLNGIIGITQSLKSSLGAQYEEELGILESSGWRMLKLVDDILQMAREGIVKDKQAPQPINIEALCRDCLRAFIGIASSKHMTLKMDCNHVGLLEMALDGARLRQIIINLVDNAFKFTPANGQVSFNARYDSDIEKLEIIVRDTGPGIPVARRQAIFEPFSQLEPVITRAHDGAGLGLALTHKLVTLHDGTIEVYDNEGGGSLFIVRLPARHLSATTP